MAVNDEMWRAGAGESDPNIEKISEKFLPLLIFPNMRIESGRDPHRGNAFREMR